MFMNMHSMNWEKFYLINNLIFLLSFLIIVAHFVFLFPLKKPFNYIVFYPFIYTGMFFIKWALYWSRRQQFAYHEEVENQKKKRQGNKNV